MTETKGTQSVIAPDDGFIRRHVGPDGEQIETMLEELGMKSLDALIDRTVPASIRSREPLDLPGAISERAMLKKLRGLAEQNTVATSLIGMGYYGTVTPNVILRNILENPGWYTAYTPYQAEVSQGRLEALLTFQQVVSDLTGMDLANASLLDEGTAAAEAMAMARRVSKSPAATFFVDADCHPQTIAVIETRARGLGIDVVVGDPRTELGRQEAFGVLVQYPGSSGEIWDLTPVAEQIHAGKGLCVVASDLLALTMLKPPGEMGADVVVGSAQRFGVPMGYGGPHAAFFATGDAYKRAIPGRLIGVSVDSSGKPALRMALQTREQHIRREKATSNICTAQVLLAVMAAMYAVYHGPDGLRRIAGRVHRLTAIVAAALQEAGAEIVNTAFFDTLTVRVPGRAKEVLAAALKRNINLRPVDDDHVGLSLDEALQAELVSDICAAFATGDGATPDLTALEQTAGEGVPDALKRQSAYLEHPVFHSYRSETEMLRYLRRLAARDVALDRSMIPLGSCTMKLNATAEMIPITWREFAHLHPFAPADQTQGYRQLFRELEDMLCRLTGFDAVSLQPNAGSQGEYSGLLAIRRYHEARGDTGRNVCLIPASAHGTNPASAIMAGMSVVVVGCDEQGNVDLADLKAKAEQHAETLGALMITYPSTHGVFEEAIQEICDIVHASGGQVYMDGANLNALVGLAKPADFGADVSHINLHKTFCIPHGGGGPGMGPIGARAHLAPYLPDHAVVPDVNPHKGEADTTGTISAAPWGSASILPITWAYVTLMGGVGLTHATKVAILNANYVAARLRPHYPVLYTGANDMVAHECIIDLRPIKASSGVTVEDVAKRLVDFGFHAPTMSFPVADTLMIEPTESESRAELDRFCDAMIAIRQEIAEVEAGTVAAEESVLRHAPHTADVLTDEDWDRPYSRAQAAFPTNWVRADKYWPPVGRIDNVHGDRHLVCSCPPMEAYQEAAE